MVAEPPRKLVRVTLMKYVIEASWARGMVTVLDEF